MAGIQVKKLAPLEEIRKKRQSRFSTERVVVTLIITKWAISYINITLTYLFYFLRFRFSRTLWQDWVASSQI